MSQLFNTNQICVTLEQSFTNPEAISIRMYFNKYGTKEYNKFIVYYLKAKMG